MKHQRMRHWASIKRPAVGPNPSEASKAMAAAIEARRQTQRVMAEQYEERRKEAAAWARNRRDALAAADRAKLAEQGVTFDANGEPVLTIKQDGETGDPR